MNKVVVGGSAHTVSPGGFTLGGGHGPFSPQLGLAVDNLIQISIVGPDGYLRDVTEDSKNL